MPKRVCGPIGPIAAILTNGEIAQLRLPLRNESGHVVLKNDIPSRDGGPGVQSKAEEYRARAAECARRARLTEDPEIRAPYEEMARSWLRLADYSEEQTQNQKMQN
jgi:hypothetical protein